MGAQLHLISSQTAGKVSANRELDVVFVHGLGGDPVRTWRHGEDESTSWPHWLAEEYGERIGVWSFGYPASKFRAQRWIERLKKFMRLPYDEDAGYSMPLPDRARNALHIMVREGIGHRPCIFIVHSLGGLLIKYVLNLAHEEDKSSEEHALITNCKALLFLATPHQGSELASLVANFRVFFPSITIDELRENDSHLRKLFQWYRKYAPQYNIDTRSFYESRATAGVAVVVTPGSADPGTAGNEPVPLDADHLSISRPKIKNNPVVLEAQKLINGQLINDRLHLNHRDLKSEENIAIPELEKKLSSNNETLDTVIATLTGLPTSYIATAIPNVHKASQKSLEILDTRFQVKTSYCDGKTSVEIYAKEDVQGSIENQWRKCKTILGTVSTVLGSRERHGN